MECIHPSHHPWDFSWLCPSPAPLSSVLCGSEWTASASEAPSLSMAGPPSLDYTLGSDKAALTGPSQGSAVAFIAEWRGPRTQLSSRRQHYIFLFSLVTKACWWGKQPNVAIRLLDLKSGSFDYRPFSLKNMWNFRQAPWPSWASVCSSTQGRLEWDKYSQNFGIHVLLAYFCATYVSIFWIFLFKLTRFFNLNLFWPYLREIHQ